MVPSPGKMHWSLLVGCLYAVIDLHTSLGAWMSGVAGKPSIVAGPKVISYA